MRQLLRGARIIDGTGAAPILGHTVVVEDGRIAAVTRELPPDAPGERVELAGATLIPGLWDTHAHLYDWMGELFLAHGVTSIVDVGNYADWILAQRDGTARGRIRGPRIVACGNALGGDPTFAVRRHMSIVLHGPDDARARAREMLDRGADALKVWVFAEVAEIKAVAEEARARGRTVIGHLSVSATDAAAAGVGILAHSSGLSAATVADPVLSRRIVEAERQRLRAVVTHEPTVSRASLYGLMEEAQFDRVIEDLVARGVTIEPDLVFAWMLAFDDRTERYEAEDQRLAARSDLAYLPEDVRARFAMAWAPRRTMRPAQREELKVAWGKMRTFLTRFVQRGGRIVVGTDTTGWPVPGIGVIREIALLHDELGISPLEAIACATSRAAASVGLGRERGTIAAGMAADLVAVEGDPVENLEALARVRLVMQEGRVVDHGYHADHRNPITKPRIGMTHSYPVPLIERLSPGGALEGQHGLTLTVHGSGFVAGSVLCVGGVAVPTRVRGLDLLEADVPPEVIAHAGTYDVWVRNPLPVLITDHLHQDERSNARELVVGFA